MNIGKYCLDITEFEWRPWYRVEFEFEDDREERGYAYIHRGWLWFVLSHRVGFGWKAFHENVKNTIDEISDDNNIFKL
tara:strand:- start:30271 stop:30504 length:234 start_codon:yes stop_codon:yes gene_type:complete